MSRPDFLGRFEALARAEAPADLREWQVGLEGARVARDVKSFGEVLFETTIGTGAIDTPETLQRTAGAVIEVVARHPYRTHRGTPLPCVNIFSGELLAEIVPWRDQALGVLAQGAVGLVLAGPAEDRLVDGLLATAVGVDRSSDALRGILLDDLRQPGSRVRELPGVGVPIVDFDELRQLVIWGTLREALSALRRHGSALRNYADWAESATASANGIERIDPDSGCAGTVVTIRGTGFGDSPPPHTTVYFATGDDGCRPARLVTRPRRPEWSNTAIGVEAPAGVGIGCVGFVTTSGPPPSDPVATLGDARAAAGMLQSVLGDAFGGAGVLHGQMVIDSLERVGLGGVGSRMPCPPCLPPGPRGIIPNHFRGGPPVIRRFTVNGGRSATLTPGGSITLSWEVEGADALSIARVDQASTSRYPGDLPLPPVGAPMAESGTAGPFPIPWDAVDDWDGEYVLSTENPCAPEPVTASVRIEMREEPPLLGLADTHVHFLSHLAFAGYGIWGRPHAVDPSLPSEAAMAEALPWCSGPGGHGPGGVLPSLEGVGGHLVGGHPEFDGWPRHTTLAHQQAYVDWIKRAVDGGLRLAVCLAVNNELLANRMTEIYGPKLSTDDMSAIDRQLDAMAALVQYVKDRDGGDGWMEIARTPADARRIVAGGRLALVLGVEVDSLGGWATPEALEAAAVQQSMTPEALIEELVEALYDKGVRHVFPVHATNNAFGGPALFVRNYDAVNYHATGKSFEVEEAPPSLGVSYRVDEDEFEGGAVAEVLAYHGIAAAKDIAGGALAGVTLGGIAGGLVGQPVIGGAAGGAIGGAAALSKYPCPPQPTNWSSIPGGQINAQGLTQHGTVLVRELMRRGMLIDVDHMGHKTTEAVLALAETDRYPVVSGHTGFRELKYGYRPSPPDVPSQFSRASAADFGTRRVSRLASEVDKTPAHLEQLRRLGGMVSPITSQRDVRDCGCGYGSVLNNSAGSSKSFAQAFLYAHYYMHGRRVGLGTDVNGAGQLPGPRFGPQGSASIRDEPDWEVRRLLGRPLRVDQVFAQRDGVRYSTAISDYRHHRFMDYAGWTYGARAHAPFDAEQRDFWEAIAMWRSGVAPELADQPPTSQRTIATKNFIINLAYGLRATSRADIPVSIPFPPWMPWPFWNVNADEQLAAYLACHAATDPLRSTDSQRTRELVKLAAVWGNWTAMEASSTQGTDQWTQRNFGPTGSGLYDSNGNLSRSTAGRRDFDVNMDGMAHYGLMPDFLQDLRNVGVQPQDIATLYRSAEDYIRVWERCEERAPA